MNIATRALGIALALSLAGLIASAIIITYPFRALMGAGERIPEVNEPGYLPEDAR